MRTTIDISSGNLNLNKITAEFEQVAYLNSNDSHGRSLLALGRLDQLFIQEEPDADPLKALQDYFHQQSDWIFGFLNYDLKNNIIAGMHSANPPLQTWPLIQFFRPEFVIEWSDDRCRLHYYPEISGEERVEWLLDLLTTPPAKIVFQPIEFHQLVDKTDYLQSVQQIQQEIQRGNVYELNYCIPFEAAAPGLNVPELYQQMNEKTQAPFSVLYSDAHRALMCGSPERFLKKSGDKIFSQPIKGTCRRGSPETEGLLIEQLRNNTKERAENIMITDLVRNDLSKIAAPQSVRVEELCGIYTFKTVHQMISTVSATLSPEVSLADIFRATFPMGSMTGAPKVNALQFIDHFEVCKRGLYSGSFGYFEPNGDFDFNVVIRSFLYEKQTGNLSFEVGSAITSLSSPEEEYTECLLKAEALLNATKAADYVA